MTSQKNGQRGGILTFVLIGVGLLLLLAGGIYVSKNQARHAATTGAPTPQITQSPEQKGENKDEKKDADKPAPKPEQSQPSTRGEQTPPAQQPSTGTQPNIANTGPSAIASTGPTETLITAVALGAVVAGLGVYFRSNGRVRHAALK